MRSLRDPKAMMAVSASVVECITMCPLHVDVLLILCGLGVSVCNKYLCHRIKTAQAETAELPQYKDFVTVNTFATVRSAH